MTSKKHRKIGYILGVRVDSRPINRVLRTIRSQVAKKEKFYIVTPNPEIILKAQENSELLGILNSASLSIPDGIGIAAAKKFLELPEPKNEIRRVLTYLIQGLGVGFSIIFDRNWLLKDFEIIRGRDLFLELIKLANKKRWKVFLLGDRERSAEKTKEQLSSSYKSVKLFAHQGPNLDKNVKPLSKADQKIEKDAIKEINKVKPHFLFIAFGASKQEKWLAKHIITLNFNGAMTIGGTFDYVSGKAKLPSDWIEERGLEWLWRMINEPERIGRIFRAVVVFSFSVFLQKLGQKGY